MPESGAFSVKHAVRPLVDAAGIGLFWAALWTAIGVVLVIVVGVIDPGDIDAGEGPLGLGVVLGTAGLMCGALFGVLFALAERGRRLVDVPWYRVLLWAAVGSAALPLVTPMNDQVVFNTVPFGLLAAGATIALARRAARA